jgi:hypothetical protein
MCVEDETLDRIYKFEDKQMKTGMNLGHKRTLGRQYSISALMKQDNITEMQIYVKYEIVSFMRRQFSSLKVYI